MALEGFDYIPAVPEAANVQISDGPVRGSRSFAQTYGYGAWNPPREEPGDISASVDNQNYQLMERMSEAEREAYELALWGPILKDDGDAITRGGGCSDQALGWASSPGSDGFREEAADYLVNGNNSSIFLELNREWATCMRAAGYSEASPSEAEARITEEAASRWNGQGEQPTPDEVERSASVEREIAVADFDCRAGMDYDARRQVLEHERQQAFVDSYSAELNALS